MSAIIRTKRRTNPSLSTAALWVVLGLAVAFFLVRYGQELLLAHDLNDKAAAQRVANGRLSDENARLQALLQYYQSNKYIEQRAREDLNLRRRDEEVLIQVSPAEGSDQQGTGNNPAGQATPSVEAAQPPAERANWEKWLELFGTGP